MKAVLLNNQDYFRNINVSATVCCELGEQVVKGDRLYDVTSGDEYEVSERGFRPKRSPATAERFHWSREASLSFVGRCDKAEGRLLIDSEGMRYQWAHLFCDIESKTGSLPAGIPIVGECEISYALCPAVLIVRENAVEMLCPGDESKDEITFNCMDEQGNLIAVVLSIVERRSIAKAGKELDWEEIDAKCSTI